MSDDAKRLADELIWIMRQPSIPPSEFMVGGGLLGRVIRALKGEPAAPCQCEHPLSDHSQSNPAHCHHEWCMCEEYVPEGGEQTEGPRADLGAAVSARPCKLKPCPFCGEPKDLLIERSYYPDRWWAACGYCDACGPEAEDERQAISLWNCAERAE